jgi:hypothetical protein
MFCCGSKHRNMQCDDDVIYISKMQHCAFCCFGVVHWLLTVHGANSWRVKCTYIHTFIYERTFVRTYLTCERSTYIHNHA